MPDIEFNCQNCGKSLVIDSAGAGIQVTCPGCGAVLQVPDTNDAPQGVVNPDPPRARVRHERKTRPKAVTPSRNSVFDDFDTPPSPVAPDEVTNDWWGKLLAVLGVMLAFFGFLVWRMNSTPNTASPTPASSAQPAITKAPMPDDQYFDYLKTKSSSESDPTKRGDNMQKYLDAYPQGKHMGEARALLEKAQDDIRDWQTAQSVASVVIDCKVPLGSGQVVPVQGFIQIFETQRSLGELIVAADAGVSKPDRDLGGEFYIRAFGEQLENLLSSQHLVAQSSIQDGEVSFSGLPANKVYFIYGRGMAGSNFVGYYDSFASGGGKTTRIHPNSVGYYCKSEGFIDGDTTARMLLGSWKSIGAK